MLQQKSTKALQSKRKTKVIYTFMVKNDSAEEDKTAEAEMTSVYHGMHHGHNY